MRVCHTIKPNHKSETPTRAIFLALDLYCKNTEQAFDSFELSGYAAIHGVLQARSKKWTRELSFSNDACTLWEILDRWCKDKTRTYLVCHDSSYFLTLFDVLNVAPALGWKIQRAITSCPPCIVSLRKGRKSLTILDILNIWPMLSVGNLTGKNAQQSADECGDSEPLQRLKQLAKRAEAMMDRCTDWWHFLKANDLGGFAPTIGSQSVRVWRHGFMKHQVVIDVHDDALELARKAVYGGRVECFHIGKLRGKFYQLDINGCYAAIMQSHRMPTRIRFWTKKGSLDDIQKWHETHVIVGRVIVRTDQPCYPVRDGSMLMFPVGRFETVLAAAELTRAFIYDHIEQVKELCIYDAEYAFQDYMNALWAMETESKAFGDQNAVEKWKLLRNSFWGKWAQKGGHWENIDRTTDLEMRSWVERDYETKEVRYFRQFGGLIQEKSKEKESQESHPAIAATVTAGARQLLWKLIDSAGLENVFYVDTDSLVVNEMGYRSLHQFIDEGKLGYLKLQGTYDTIEIYNAKHYKLGNNSKHSGPPKSAVDNGKGALDFTVKQSLDESIRNNRHGKVVGIHVRREYNGEYRKGVVGKDGKVAPRRIEQ